MKNWFDIKAGLWGRVWPLLLSPFLGKKGKGVIIIKPMKIKGLSKIFINKHVRINNAIWLEADQGHISIGEGTVLGNFNHIYATQSLNIGEHVLTADKVYLSDCTHSFEDINLPVLKQPILKLKETSIGDNSWLGENVIVIGAKVGKHCIIGSNSVVNKDIPDYSVAVGSPARVIKKYSFKEEKWIRVKENV